MTQAPPTQPAPDDATPSLRSEHVAEAVLHFIRLAASHANYGITFTDLDLVPDETDSVSLKALEDVVGIMLKDRARVCRKMANVLTARTLEIVAEAFTEAQHDPETEQNVEDVIARRLRDRLGLKLSPDEEKKLAVDAEFIKTQKGPSNAAATLLGQALGLETGSNRDKPRRNDRGCRDRVATRSPCGPRRNRWGARANDDRRPAFCRDRFHARHLP